MMFLPEGTPAPSFSLTAIVSKRPISPQDVSAPLLLLFHGYQATAAVATVIQTVRKAYPSPDQVLIASVADLHIVPRLLRGMARSIMENAYQNAARQVPPGEDPSDHIILLPDWSGAVFSAYQIPETKENVALVLIDQTRVIGSYVGPQPGPAAIDVLANQIRR